MATEPNRVPLGRIDRPRTVELVVEALAKAIGQGIYAPGQRLPSERELCQAFGVGRNTLREALKQLEALSVVQIKQGEGTFVCNAEAPMLSRALRTVMLVGGISLDEIIEARKTVELETTRLAAGRATEADLGAIAAVMGAMRKAVDSPERFTELDRRFHYMIAVASHNKLFPRFLESIRDVLQDQQKRISEAPTIRERVLEYHQGILDALRRRDAERAVSLMNEHLMNIRLRLTKADGTQSQRNVEDNQEEVLR